CARPNNSSWCRCRDARCRCRWHHDIGTNKSYWDARSREIFGLVAEKDEVTADLWHTYLHPDDKEATERAHQIAPGSNDVVASQYRIIRRDGEVRHLESLVRFVAAAGA
ncbi:hypothetical protein EN823_14755, partial [bacterium M00.F.Ca.ET.180.01.1.1]